MIPSTLSPSVALAAYAEPWIEGRRVVVFGEATAGLAEYLIDRGARLVHVYDHEPARVAEASARSTSRNISFAPFGQAGIAVRDAAFDFGIIENLTLAQDPGDLLQRLVRALSARGAAIVAAPNPDARLKLLMGGASSYAATIGYYELYDRVAEHFQEVRMLGQLPFVGYAVADFSPEHEPNISIDTALIPGGAEEPEWFLALVSHQPLAGDTFTIVELPFSQVLRPGQDPAQGPALARARAQEQVLLERVEQLETEALALRDTRKPGTGDRGGRDAVQTELKQQIVELKDQIGKRDAWLAQLEARAATADTRADQAEAELEKQKDLATKLAQAAPSQLELQKARDLLVVERDALLKERDLERGTTTDLRRRVEELKAQDETARHEIAKFETALKERNLQQGTTTDLRRRIEELEAQDETARHEIAKFEAVLKERGELIQRLERELKEAERIATDLAQELETTRLTKPETAETPSTAAELAELRNKLDNLAFANAEREANLFAADWTISELETKLALLSAPAETTLEAQLTDAGAPLPTHDGESSSSTAVPR